MRIILSGGGTGGHIYPAVTIAQAIKKIHQDADMLFIGTKSGLESSIIPKLNYDIEYIEVEGFSRKIGWSLLKNIYKAFKGCWQARKIIKKNKPDLVIGTGGYVCGPVVLMAYLAGVPTCIQEQNAQVGVTNKILSRFVNRIFLGYEKAAEQFGAKSIFTGNPVRSSIFDVNKEVAYTHFDLSSARKTLLVYGGSRGARSINAAMLEVYRNIDNFPQLQIVHVTGTNEYERFMEMVADLQLPTERVKIYPYMYEMDLALNIADLAISRAGAIAIAEFLALGVPAILVPYPYATANHQYFNALAVAERKAGSIVADDELEARIVAELEGLLWDEEKLTGYAHQAKILGRKDAAEHIARLALELVVDNGR